MKLDIIAVCIERMHVSVPYWQCSSCR